MDGVRNRGLNAEPRVAEGILDPLALEAPRIDVSDVLENLRTFVREVGAPFLLTRTVLVVAAALAVGGLPLSPLIPPIWYRLSIAPTVDAFAAGTAGTTSTSPALAICRTAPTRPPSSRSTPC